MGASNSYINLTDINATYINLNEYACSDRGLVLPIINEYTWPRWLRVILYFAGLLYLFMGIAAIADIFMSAIEKITSVTRTVRVEDPNNPGEYKEKKVKVWNETVANLTLMALGSSSPEILLSIIEIIGNNFKAGDLGPGTIVGSAAYNLLCISAICVIAIPNNQVTRIKNFKVFLNTTFWASFAYIWLYIVLVLITPNVVTLWEAIVTLICFPIVVVSSYLAEKNFFIKKKNSDEDEENANDNDDDDEKELFLKESVNHVNSRDVLKYTKSFNERDDISDEAKAKLILNELLKEREKSQMHYRINGTRQMIGGRKIEIELNNELKGLLDNDEQQNDSQTKDGYLLNDFDSSKVSILEFDVFSYSVFENAGKCSIKVKRYGGDLSKKCRFRLKTLDGTAEANLDYRRIDQVYTMDEYVKEFNIDIPIINEQETEDDETFFVILSLCDNNEDEDYNNSNVKLGNKKLCKIVIMDDDNPGQIEFSQNVYQVKETCGYVEVNVERNLGAGGKVAVSYTTNDETALADKDYIPSNGILVFDHGEVSKTIQIKILNDNSADEKIESFSILLYDPKNGVKLGSIKKTVISITNDESLLENAKKISNLVNSDLEAIDVTEKTWSDQFKEALNVNGGNIKEATSFDYFTHVLAFPWKVMFAFVPPPSLLGGYLCFFCSLLIIGLLTAIVGDVASIFGCLVGLKDSVTAITFVAMGTSLPDTFASKIAAQNDKTADNAIGNITGSNSVNVFLGLGLPWVIAAIFWQIKGAPFEVNAGSLTFSIAVYTIVSIICLGLLFLRRYLSVFGKGELGGPTIPKYLTGCLYVFLWFIYILLSSLQAYNILPF